MIKIEINAQIGAYKILEDITTTNNAKFRCRCVCGKVVEKFYSSIIKKGKPRTTKCLCSRLPKYADLTGRKAGKYTIIEKVFSEDSNNTLYKCRCECGFIKIKPSNQLYKNGKMVETGCHSCTFPKGEFHGWEKERAIWKDMIERCHKKNTTGYKYYGARGIKVCRRWRNSFWSFTRDIGKIAKGMSIERINNDGDYCPKNCTLIPRSEQPLNRRNTVWVTIKGRKLQLRKWLKKYNVSRELYYARLRRGLTPEQAILSPKKYIGMWVHLAK